MSTALELHTFPLNTFIKTRRITGYALILMGLVAGQPGWAQTKTYEQQTMNGTAPNTASAAGLRSFSNSVIGTKGSPLALPSWVSGELTLESGKAIPVDKINYDVYNKQVTVKRSARDSVAYETAVVKQLVLQPVGAAPLRYEHVPGLITDEAALKTDLLRLVYQGNYSLVELPVRTFIKAPAKQTYGGLGEVSNEFRDESTYYLIRPDHTVEKVKLAKKSLVRALKDKGASFESFLKTNSINVENEAEVAKALAMFEQK